MAVKNHALDEKIVEAARKEFLEKGFRNASLHQISERAGITTGALYTRYKNKDALFCSLVQEMLEEAERASERMRGKYEHARESGDASEMLHAIREEEAVYAELLFSHRDACILFFCRSGGSSLEVHLAHMMEDKAKGTVEYLRQIARKDADLDGVAMLISSQFEFFRQVLEKDYSREKMIRCMKLVECYMEAGWKALLEEIL